LPSPKCAIFPTPLFCCRACRLEGGTPLRITGDHIDGKKRDAPWYVNEVVPADQLIPTARALAERIAKVPEPSVRLISSYLLRATSSGLHSGMLLNGALSALAHTSHLPCVTNLLAAMGQGVCEPFWTSVMLRFARAVWTEIEED